MKFRHPSLWRTQSEFQLLMLVFHQQLLEGQKTNFIRFSVGISRRWPSATGDPEGCSTPVEGWPCGWCWRSRCVTNGPKVSVHLGKYFFIQAMNSDLLPRIVSGVHGMLCVVALVQCWALSYTTLHYFQGISPRPRNAFFVE